MVEKWLRNYGRQQDWISHMLLWVESTFFWSYPYSPNPSLFIDLIFTNQPNFVIDSGVHPLFHPNCHHQVVFSKLNLKIKYPPLYERLVWDYKNTDWQSINKAIEMFNWEKLFRNKNIHEQPKLFNETIVNIVRNYIPNKFITCSDKDPP